MKHPRYSSCLCPILGSSEILLQFIRSSSSIHQKFFFSSTEGFLWFYWNAEPSTLSRRAFAIATPSARRFDDEPSATSWIQRSASVGVWKKVKENKGMKGSPLQLPQGGGKNVKREVWSVKRSHPDGKANGLLRYMAANSLPNWWLFVQKANE